MTKIPGGRRKRSYGPPPPTKEVRKCSCGCHRNEPHQLVCPVRRAAMELKRAAWGATRDIVMTALRQEPNRERAMECLFAYDSDHRITTAYCEAGRAVIGYLCTGALPKEVALSQALSTRRSGKIVAPALPSRIIDIAVFLLAGKAAASRRWELSSDLSVTFLLELSSRLTLKHVEVLLEEESGEKADELRFLLLIRKNPRWGSHWFPNCANERDLILCCWKQVQGEVKTAWPKIEDVAEALLEHDRLSGAEIARIMLETQTSSEPG